VLEFFEFHIIVSQVILSKNRSKKFRGRLVDPDRKNEIIKNSQIANSYPETVILKSPIPIKRRPISVSHVIE
jgi:hypothetical protein